MKLDTLTAELQTPFQGSQADLDIRSLAADSRQVEPGALFIAVRGTNVDGHRYLSDAAARGAIAAVGEEGDPGLGIPYLQVPDSKLALAQLAAAWNGYPARRMVMIGVTGTDGKSTTSSLIHAILTQAGLKTGLITTIQVQIGEETSPSGLHVTTPDALTVQADLRRMVEAGMTHCVLETTSHGLAQRRVAACDFDVAVITNVTHEHLDYHGSYQAYLQAKARLFEGLMTGAHKENGPPKTAVLNRDDASFDALAPIPAERQIIYSMSAQAGVRGDLISSTKEGLAVEVHSAAGDHILRSPLIGTYNAHNLLAAYAATVEGLGIASEAAAQAIANVRSIPGRMEVIDLGQDFTAIVDFAHTPNALRAALETARRLTAGRVIAVFGSAGLRDREKRRMMAEVSAELADLTVLTAEDPRTEDLDGILAEMAAGAEAKGVREGETYVRIPDRGEALRFAVREARPGDLVISCGKGHEQSMCFGEIEYPWDDRTALRAALAEHLGTDGPEMPSLPTSS